MTYRIKIRTKRKPKFVSEYYYIMKRLGGPYGLQKRAIRGTFLRDVKLAIKSYRKDYLQRKRRTLPGAKTGCDLQRPLAESGR